MTALPQGWCWQLNTAKKRHFFVGHASLCGRHVQRASTFKWSEVPGAWTLLMGPGHYQCHACHAKALELLALIRPVAA
mgnify:CR=1 FL=1